MRHCIRPASMTVHSTLLQHRLRGQVLASPHLAAGLLSLALSCLQLLPGLLQGIPGLTADLRNLHQGAKQHVLAQVGECLVG